MTNKTEEDHTAITTFCGKHKQKCTWRIPGHFLEHFFINTGYELTNNLMTQDGCNGIKKSFLINHIHPHLNELNKCFSKSLYDILSEHEFTMHKFWDVFSSDKNSSHLTVLLYHYISTKPLHAITESFIIQ